MSLQQGGPGTWALRTGEETTTAVTCSHPAGTTPPGDREGVGAVTPLLWAALLRAIETQVSGVPSHNQSATCRSAYEAAVRYHDRHGRFFQNRMCFVIFKIQANDSINTIVI